MSLPFHRFGSSTSLLFHPTTLSGVVLVEPKPARDERGYFARVFCEEEFSRAGLESRFEQSSLSRNVQVGTLRGMHYQAAPHAEAKFVRCTRGAIFDVALDLRIGSPTFGRWIGQVLSAENGLGFYVPAGCAHGFQTLEPDTDVFYQITPSFTAGLGRGVRWNDPAFGIDWPIANPIISERDRIYPDFVR